MIRQDLQPVGLTALLLTSKYEEIYPPEVSDVVYATDRAYKKEKILEMESRMLNTATIFPPQFPHLVHVPGPLLEGCGCLPGDNADRALLCGEGAG